MEMFLLCSDDSESDVRMVADECLNKIIKVRRNHFLASLQRSKPLFNVVVSLSLEIGQLVDHQLFFFNLPIHRQ